MLIILLSGFFWYASRSPVWSDEFNYTGMPDPAKWGYEEGFVRNREAQYYTKARAENCRVENGMLVIEARKESFNNAAYVHGSKNWRTNKEFARYTSASLTTKDKFSFRYGKIEVRAKFPQGKGTWFTIWTLDTKPGTHTRGEIDIAEYLGKNPDEIIAAAHFTVNGKYDYSIGKHAAENAASDFHIYSVTWTPERIDFFFDNKRYHTFHVRRAGEGDHNQFYLDHHLLLSLALGGSSGGKIDNSVLPQKALVDYIRVFRY